MPISEGRWRYFGSLVIIPPAHLRRGARRCILERGATFRAALRSIEGGKRKPMSQTFDGSGVDDDLLRPSGPGDYSADENRDDEEGEEDLLDEEDDDEWTDDEDDLDDEEDDEEIEEWEDEDFDDEEEE
jgi:hypothetical protein